MRRIGFLVIAVMGILSICTQSAIAHHQTGAGVVTEATSADAGSTLSRAMAQAKGDSVDWPDRRLKFLDSNCTGNWERIDRRNVSLDPWAFDYNWRYATRKYSAARTHYTDRYIKNSIKRAHIGRRCVNGQRYRVWLPTTYIHKNKYNNFACGSLSCRFLFSKTTPGAKSEWWLEQCWGTSENKVVCTNWHD